MDAGLLLPQPDLLGDRRLVVVSHRQPYAHVRHGKSAAVQVEKPPSGLTLALEPIVVATHGTWIAASGGNADAEFTDARGYVRDPPPDSPYRLRRLTLPPSLREDFYTGFANSSLWPLCHIAYHQPRFEEKWWRAYQAVNEIFAQAVAEEIGGEPATVFIQDFHLALAPQMVRARCPRALIAQFWHIPWPNPEAFRICPWRRELLEGMLGNDLLGFHLSYHGMNFMETLDRELAVRIDREHNLVSRPGAAGGLTKIGAFPISVDAQAIIASVTTSAAQQSVRELRERYARGRQLVLTVERMDYSKGIRERLEAIQRLFERHPQWRDRVSFVQIATPSRTDVRAYRDYAAEVDHLVAEINRRWGVRDWKPVLPLHQYVEPRQVWNWYLAADALIVSSLHDGMNLVAKEFAAAARDDAVLLLSEYTGAAREFREAVLLNPYAIDDFADKIAAGLEMPLEQRRERLRRLRWRVLQYDIGAWAADILRALRQHYFDNHGSAFPENSGGGMA